MEPIHDFSWMQQMLNGKIRERFTFEAFDAVALEIPDQPVRHSPFHYRILFFPRKSGKPVLSLNLESSILGSYCFTEHTGNRHLNLGHTDEAVSYEEFRTWALAEAGRALH